jgi:hypothetical protein
MGSSAARASASRLHSSSTEFLCAQSGSRLGRVTMPPILAKSFPSGIIAREQRRLESECLRDRANYLRIITEDGRSDPVAGRSTLDLGRELAPTVTAPPPRVAAALIAAPSLAVFRIFACFVAPPASGQEWAQPNRSALARPQSLRAGCGANTPMHSVRLSWDSSLRDDCCQRGKLGPDICRRVSPR